MERLVYIYLKTKSANTSDIFSEHETTTNVDVTTWCLDRIKRVKLVSCFAWFILNFLPIYVRYK
jgi:hypothetical protein